MTLKKKGVFTAVEFGTSKISVIHCELDEAMHPVVSGFGTRDAAGSIVKGEPVDLAAVSRILTEAFSDADKSAGTTPDRGDVYYLVSGTGMQSNQGTGYITVYENDSAITDEHINEVIGKAMSCPIPDGKINIDSLISYYVIDAKHRVREPLGYNANRLDAFVHLISADKNHLENLRSLLRDIGFEGQMVPVVSVIGAAYGAFNGDEKEQGGLLIDIGAGVTDYILVHDDGVMASGTIPVGMDNLANDLSIGLDLTIDQARRIIMENNIDMVRKQNLPYLELPVGSGSVRQIPLASLEKISDMRMLEIFSLIRDELEKNSLLKLLRGGVVLTGGGSLYCSAEEHARSIFQVHVRTGIASEITGAMTGLENPRYTALLGALKYIVQQTGPGSKGSLGPVADLFENLAGDFVDKFKSISKAFRKI